MNIVFWFIVLVLLAIVWLLASSAFWKIGNASHKVYKKAKDEIEREDDPAQEETKEEIKEEKDA